LKGVRQTAVRQRIHPVASIIQDDIWHAKFIDNALKKPMVGLIADADEYT